MLNIIAFLLNIIENYTTWIYVGCGLVVLAYLRAYLRARSARANTIFTIERELAAHQEGRAMSSIGTVLGLVVIVVALRYYIVPVLQIDALVEPTPTVLLTVPTREPTITPTLEPTPSATPTGRPRATRRPAEATATPTQPPPPPPPCPDPNVRITSPGMGARVNGRVPVRGSALNDRFQFYKVELGVGESPDAWHSLGPISKSPVNSGVLEEFDSTSVPNGTYWLRLTVVDITGNYPTPCDVRVVVQN